MATQKVVNGVTFSLPYRGRLGCTIESTLRTIMSSDGIALYAAMNLSGRAKSYEGKYRRAFIRFAEANKDKLEAGPVGPKGGFGYRYKAPQTQRETWVCPNTGLIIDHPVDRHAAGCDCIFFVKGVN